MPLHVNISYPLYIIFVSGHAITEHKMGFVGHKNLPILICKDTKLF